MANYKGYIYKITNNINGHSYVGKTNNIERRWKEHKYGHGRTAILAKAFKKYGLDKFIFSIERKVECLSINSLNKLLNVLEIYYINHYNTFRAGYNATIGGEGICHYVHSEETKKKISKSNTGKKKSPEAIEKSRIANLGRKHSYETRQKISKAVLSRDPKISRRAAEKRRGQKRSREAILATATKISKPVLQYSLDGDFIQEHPRISTIENMNVAQLIACCKGKLNSAYGYIWRYKTCSDYPHKIKAAENYHISNLKIIQYSKEGKKIAEYNSITEAARLTNIIRTGIGNCLKGWSKSAGGYLWKYKKDELLDNK